METTAQSGDRLIEALEDLVTQEAAAVHADDFAAIESLQARAGEVGERLIQLSGDPGVAARRDRILALMARREHSRQVLLQRLTDVQNEILRLQATRQRMGKLLPAYGSAGGARPSFTAAA